MIAKNGGPVAEIGCVENKSTRLSRACCRIEPLDNTVALIDD